MALVECIECGNSISDSASSCPSCGHATGQYLNKSKIAAVLLAFFLGGLGLHKFYLGKNKAGVLYLVFCWTFIPAILGVIDAFILLIKDQREFSGSVSQNGGKVGPLPASDTFSDQMSYAIKPGVKKNNWIIIGITVFVVLALISLGGGDNSNESGDSVNESPSQTADVRNSDECFTIRTDITMLRTSFSVGEDSPQEVGFLLEAARNDFSRAADSFSGSKAAWLEKMAELSGKVGMYISTGTPADGPKALDQLYANMNLVDQFCE